MLGHPGTYRKVPSIRNFYTWGHTLRQSPSEVHDIDLRMIATLLLLYMIVQFL